jgi:hypothetical protein
MGAKNRVGTGLPYWPARLHAGGKGIDSTGSLKVYKFRARICKRLRGPGMDSKESILPAYTSRYVKQGCRTGLPGLELTLKGLQIWAQAPASKYFPFHSCSDDICFRLPFEQISVYD